MFVLAVIGMMIVPLPTALIDLLIASNLGFSVLLLAGALYMRSALSFAAFPTLLLLSTLYRLALNVSSTRLILLHGDAGRVIESFGRFVVQGDYRVGALVFAMLTLIQFIVIARGAERVAEVSARFSLDALPGKQLAIDAEVRAGTLRPEAARAQRRQLERESQLYGALDGALKFVKGDAIAGLVITVVNFAGGVALGVFARGLDLQTSLTTYGLLTIGDGLVTQLPALLGATTAGLVVTRVAPAGQGDSLARDITAQLASEPRALWVGALALGVLALVPGLPSWPFLLVAVVCAGLAYSAERRAASANQDVDGEVVALKLELGRELFTRLCDRTGPTSALARAIAHTRGELLTGLGIELPSLHVRLSTTLAPRSFRWLWRELPGAELTVARMRDAPARIGAALDQLARQNAADCLDLEAVQRMVDRLADAQPALVRNTIPRPLTLSVLAQVLRLLVAEGVNVRWLGEIVEAIAPHAESSAAPILVEHARKALARRITHRVAPLGQLHLLRLAPELEETLSDALKRHDGDEVLALPPDLGREIEDAVVAARRTAPTPHALVTQAGLRRHVRVLLLERAPDLAVLTAYELAPHLTLSLGEPIGP